MAIQWIDKEILMKVSLLLIGMAILTTHGSAGLTSAQGIPFMKVPSPLAENNPLQRMIPRMIPNVGASFNDAGFNNELVRVTEEAGLRHEYSRHDPFNRDHSMIVLLYPPKGEVRIYRTASLPYDRKENLVRTVDVEEPRWDSDDPKVLWGLQGFRLVRIEVTQGQTEVVKDFSQDTKIIPVLREQPDLYRITTKDEGEPSMDKRFWAFFIQGANDDYRPRYIITWDRKENSILGLYKLPKAESSIDWVGMSPLGKWVLIGGDPDNGGRLAGLTIADKGLSTFHRLDHGTAHADVGLDVYGNEVIIMQNTRTDFIDLIPIDLKTKPVLESGGSYDRTNRAPLVRLFYSSESAHGLNSGVHISCNFPGYAVISTYIPPNMPEQNWLDRSIILVKLDSARPQVFYLAKVYGTTATYWEETQAAITGDGSRVVWASNWNRNVGEAKTFLIQLNMPKDWAGLIR
jgi:hypothetical protein